MTNTEQTPDEFKVGDVVYDVAYGEGKIEKISVTIDRDYAYQVMFPCITYFVFYDCNGVMQGAKNRTLFFSEPKIEASVKRPFTPTLVGKTVYVEFYDDEPGHGYLWRVKGETATHIDFHESHSYSKSVMTIVYEVSSENLLKP